MKKQALHIISIVVLFHLILNSKLDAATRTWTGSVNTSWSTAGNWSSSSVPDSLDNIVINSNAPNNLTLTQNRKVTSFTINGDTLDLGGYTLTVTGTCTFSGGKTTTGTIKPIGSLCHFGGGIIDSRIEASCGYFHMNGCTFNKPVILISAGTSSTTGTGNCTFLDSLTINHSGTFYFTMGSTYGDDFQTVTINNTSTHEVYLGSSDTSFINGNLIINNTSTGGVAFGNTDGVTFLASGKSISIGSGGFTADYLTLKNFYQLGSTAQTLTLTGTAAVNCINANFNGNLTLTTPGFLLKNSTFNGTTSITRNGSSGNFHSDGGNVFADLTLDNAGTGRIRMANTAPDNYLGNVTFNSTGGQDVQIAYSGNNIFEGNITINSNKVVFNTASGKVTFSGGNAQTLNGSYNFPFKKLAINKSANNVTANTTLGVDDTLFFINGNLITTSTNLLTMKAGSATSGASNASFICGPIKKVGSSAFIFPTGKGTYFASISISAPSNATDSYTAEYFLDAHGVGENKDSTLEFVPAVRYWDLSRNSGSSNVYVSLGWTSGTSVNRTSDLKIAKWDGSNWKDKGNGSLSGDASSGSLQSSAVQSSFGKFILARNKTAFVSPNCTTVPIIEPFAYYSFDVTGQPESSSYYLNPNQSGTANPLTGGMAISSNLKPRSLNNAITTDNISVPVQSNIRAYNNVPLTDYLAIEFILRFSNDFINQKTGEIFKIGGQSGTIEYPTTGSNILPFIKFETEGLSGTTSVTDEFIVELTGIDRKSISYYLDDEYHHFCFVYNALTGEKEIWVDGELNLGFSKTITPGVVMSQGSSGNQLFLWSGGNTSKFRGDLDEIAIYDQQLCVQQIVEHYIDAITNQGNYDFSGTYSATTSSNNLDGTLVSDDYVYGYDISTNSYASSPEAIEQLKTMPFAKFRPGHTFRRNASWMQMQYVGGLWQNDQTQIGWDNSIAIQKELSLFWNYYFNVVENTVVVTNLPGTGESSYTAAWIDFANQNYKDERYQFAIKMYRAQMNPDELGYAITEPYISSLNLSNPFDNYLNDGNVSSTTYFDRIGNSFSTPKYWSPKASTNSYLDGEVQRDYLNDFLFNSSLGIFLNPEIKISYVGENNEIIIPFSYTAGVPVAPSLDPNVVSDKNTNFSTLDWSQYLGLKKSEIDLDYSDVFMNGSVAQIEDALFLNYGVDGADPTFTFTYEYLRNTQKEIDGMRYSTPSIYPEGPEHWFQTQSATHGMDWLQKARKQELIISSGVDNRFAPFVSAGWSLNETENMRPAQYLGFLKSIGMFGIDFYHPGFFNGGFPCADPKGYIWQVSTPSYAQAVFTRAEEFFTDGTLQLGDIDLNRLDPGTSGMGFMFNTGDYTDLVNVRKVNSQEKFLISGAPMPCSNMGGNVPDQKTVTINLDPISSNLSNATFDIRRQGSIYNIDATNSSDIIVTQLDKWHQSSHPYQWTKDFFFEAELYDNSPSAVIKTRKPDSDDALTGGDFSQFDTYLDYSGGTYSTEYHFSPRDNSSLSIDNDYVLYIRAREVDGTGSDKSIKVELRSIDNSQSFVTSLSCVNNSTPSANLEFKWYKVCSSNSTFENLKPDLEYILTLTPEDIDLEIDQIYLESPDPDDPFPIVASDLSGAIDCDNVTLSINSTSVPCTGPLSTATVTAAITNCSGSGTYDFEWSNGSTSTGVTSSVITNADPLQIYTVTVTSGGMSPITASSSPLSTTTYDFKNPEITTSTVWDNTINGTSTIKVQGVILVKSGSTLTIDDGMQIEFSYGVSPDEVCDQGLLKSGIIVEIGGKLDLQPNTVLTGCNDGIWEGVEVLGDYTEGQSPTSLQGFVEINGTSGNEAEIRYANIGILGVKAAGMVCDYRFGGGIINANYCNFKDNSTAVKMINYIGSESYFQNCNFEVTDNFPFTSYSDKYGPIMVQLVNHQGVKIKECTFNRSDFASINPDERGIGIQAYNSSFSLQDLSGFGSGANTFSNLTQGISVYQYLGAALQNNIEGNIFDNVMQGMYMQGIGTDIILNNEFINMPLPDAGLQTYGIYVVDGTGFEIRENEFTSSLSGSSDQYALGFENCDGVVFKNFIFESAGGAKFDIGLQTQEDNSHLKLGCNEFSEPGTYSVAVASGSLRQQGYGCNNDGEPSGNVWIYNSSPGCTGEENIYVESAVPTFNYYKYAKDVSSDVNPPNPSCHTSGKINFPACALDQSPTSCNSIFPGLNIQPPPIEEYEDYKDAIVNLISTFVDSASVDSINSKFYLSEIWLLELEMVKWQMKYEGLEAVISTLYNSSTFEAKKQIALIYLQQQMTDSVTSIIDEISRDSVTSRSIENGNFISIVNSIKNALDENGILDLKELNQVTLYDNVELVSRSSSKAEVLLNMAGLENYRHSLSSLGGGSRYAKSNLSTVNAKNEFVIFPNPANEKIALSYKINNACEKTSIVIYDKLGNEIINKQLNGQSGTIEISAMSLAPALYYCKLISCNEETLKKLVIIK